ncbi:MAG: hypothetical protein ACRD19_09275, partial [Terriglobia bacterium]
MISNRGDETLLWRDVGALWVVPWRSAIPLLAACLLLPLLARAQAGPVTADSVIEALRAHDD